MSESSNRGRPARTTPSERRKKASEIQKWIEQTGYPLELRTARALRSLGFVDVGLSQYFQVPGEDKLRECDVVGSVDVSLNTSTWTHGRPPFDSVRLTAVIECKYTKLEPFVIFAAERDVTLGDYARSYPANLSGRRVLNSVTADEPAFSAKFRDTVGYRVREYDALDEPPQPKAEEKSKDRRPDPGRKGFYAIMNAIHAAEARAVAHNDSPPGSTHPEIMVPAVILDGPLFLCDLTKGNKIRVKPSSRSSILQTAWGLDRIHTRVEIASIDELRKRGLLLVLGLRAWAYLSSQAILEAFVPR